MARVSIGNPGRLAAQLQVSSNGDGAVSVYSLSFHRSAQIWQPEIFMNELLAITVIIHIL